MKLNQYPVVIVGAGLAGLRCSIELKRHGIEHVIIEKSEKPGGRAASENHLGFLLDVGFQVLLDSYPELDSALNLTNLSLQKFDSGAYISENGRLLSLFNPLKHPNKIVEAIAQMPATLPDVYRLLVLFLSKESGNEDFFKNPGDSTVEFLKKKGFSTKIIRMFFQPFFSGVFLDQDLQLPSSYFQWLLGKFAVGQATLPANGMGDIAKEMARNSGPIFFNAELVQMENGLITLANGDKVEAEWIVSAYPEATNREALAYSETHTIYVKCPDWKNLPKCLILNANEGGNILHLCFPSAIQASYAPVGHALCSITLKNKWSSGEFSSHDFENLKKELAFIYPETDWLQAEFLKHYYVKKALPKWQGGHQRTFEITDKTLFIGDRFAYPSINGALRSGREAAGYLIQKLKKAGS